MSSTSAEDVSKIIEKNIKSTNPRELALKGLYYGRLWFKAGDYNNAAEWIVKYLRKYDRDAQAHRLLGECYEKLSEYETALASYKQSLHIKPNQYDLVVHVAELFLNPGPTQNPTKAQIWLDKATTALPGDSTVFKMKMELLLAQQASPQVLEEAILKELKINPNDPSLHIQYVTFMKTQERIRDAYLYCNSISNVRDCGTIESNYKWCSCVVNTYKDFIASLKVSANSQEYISIHCLLLEAISRLISLCIVENKHAKALEKLLIMDQYLLRVSGGNVTNEWKIVVEELKGQMSWLVATFLLHQANEGYPQDPNYLSWKEAAKLSTFFYSYSLSKPLPTLSSAWAVHCGSSLPKIPFRLHKTASVRLSQCSHMMWLLASKAGDTWKATVASVEGSESIGYIVFGQLFGQSRDGHSSFLSSGQVLTDNIEVPSITAMLHYDESAALCRDLKMFIWLGMRWLELEDYVDFLPWTKKAFPDLKLSSGTSASSSVLSMNVLDVESFIASCVYTTEKKSGVWKNLSTNDPFSLSCVNMPLALCRQLTTELQDKWWECACSISVPSKLSATVASKLKPIMQRGLQCLRGIGNHGLEITLVVKLAKYFATKAFAILERNAGASTAWFAYQRRSALYWALAIPELIRLSEGVTTSQNATKDSLFPKVFSEPSQDDAESFLSEGYMCHGELAAQEQRNDDALSFYGKATIPQASFCQAHIYKQMCEKMMNSSSSETPFVDVNRQMEMYMKKHRHFLEVTLSRLQQQPDESLHERTIRLLRSPHVSPPRLSVTRSPNDSTMSGPSKQSTPKMNQTSDNALSSLVEKEAVTNLMDTITTLTSALSSLQMEMGYLREENRIMRQSSPAGPYNNSPHGPHPHAMMNRSNQPFTPPMYYPQDAHRPAQTATPQRAYVPSNAASYPALGSEDMPAVPNQIQAQQNAYLETYQQQRQTLDYYNPALSSPYVQNYGYQDYADKGAVASNDYGGSGYAKSASGPAVQEYPASYSPNVAAQGYPTPYTPNAEPGAFSANQPPSNLLAASLQNKDTDALQQKFGSLLAGMQKPNESNAESSSRGQVIQHPTTDNTISVEALGHSNQALTAQAPAAAQPSLIQQLLQDGKVSISTTPIAKKEIKQDAKALLNTPVVSKPEEVQFLHRFVSPKSPGTNMKFQSPEQMDRENQELNALEQADADTSQNNDTGPHFEPVIPLPDLVEVKTGEEDEDVLFAERCKLYRFVDNQWKERGLGQMKLLKNPSSGKSRLVMRREHVLKLCCNHHVLESTLLSSLPSCDRAMTWHARDFADGELVHEKLTAKFKTVEIAERFRDAVNEEASALSEPERSDAKAPAPVVTFASPFATQSSNSNNSQILEVAAAKFQFEMPKPSPIVQTSQVSANEESEQAKPSPFSNLANALSSSGFPGSGPIGGIKLSSATRGYQDSKSKDSSAFNGASLIEERDVSSESKEQEEEPDDAGPHFEPVINLPKLVQLTTGEENEEVVFQRRAKLFRYVTSEWKERGLGDMKILKHKVTGKYRIVMRREQVLKICANHHILSGMRLAPHGTFGKAWIWSALDFSESIEEPENETFAVRFKTTEEAKEFYDKFMEGTNITDTQTGKGVSSASMPAPALFSQAANASQSKNKTAPQLQLQQQQFPQRTSEEVKLQPAMWNCTNCRTSNMPGTDKCSSCRQPNPPLPPPAKTGFNFGVNTAPKFGFGQAPSFITKEENSTVGKSVNDKVASGSASKGFNLPAKPPGSWECPDCYSPNTADHETCPCCNCSNPNLPAQPKPTDTGFNFGFGAAPKFGFGDSTPVTTKEQTSDDGKSTGNSGFNLPAKPPGCWECPDCYSSNTADHETCPCCNCSNPNLPSQPKPTGFNLPAKPLGSWECPDCYSSNTADHEICPCCNCSNPNLPAQQQLAKPAEKEDKFIMKFGTDMAKSTPASSSPFSFGIQQSKPNDTEGTNEEDAMKQHPTLQRAGGSKPTTFKFGFGNTTSSSNAPGNPLNPFMAPSPLNIFDASDQPSWHDGQPTKPRFPIDDYDDSGTDDDETSDTDDSDEYAIYSETEDQVQNESQLASTISHRSPMHRFADKPTENDDVICMGEVLPSKELQDKARELQLPPHFYNYLEKEGAAESETKESAVTSQPEPVSTSVTQSTSTPTVFGSNAGVSFAQLAASSSTTGFSFNVKPVDKQDPAWKPDSKPMFSAEPSDDHDNTNDSYQEDDGEHIHVKPAISLPPIVAVKTGEENETTLLSIRAKLFRFDAGNSAWKERGVGNVMIKHNASSQTFRVLMRREQVLKVCANHLITNEIKLEPALGSDRAWTWLAVDFADDEKKVEKFAIRFKTEEDAQKFKDQVEECQLLLQKKNEEKDNGQAIDTSMNTLFNKAEKMKSELGFFKDKLSMKTTVDLENTFTEGLGRTETQIPKPNVQLTPLVKQHEMDKEKKQKESRIPRLVPGNKTEKEKTPESKNEPGKNSLELDKFAFSMKPEAKKTSEIPVRARPIQQRNISVCSTTSEDSQVDNIHFEPVIPLPEKVVVQTGEENDQALFEERAKLYIFHREDQAWKERGIGKIRILQNLTSFKLRLVMRREQVLKLCLNHKVSIEMNFEYKANSPSVLTWAALDFSDVEKPEGEMMQFALRFKTPEIASGFMTCIDEGKKATEEKRLLEPMLELSASVVSEEQREASAHESDVEQVSSPVKSPTKNVKPTFSFANVNSPFAKKDGPFGGFAFGETPKSHPTAAAKPGKFTFDMSAISFNFGSTSTPAAPPPPVVPPASSLAAAKPTISKSLFGSDPPADDGATGSKPDPAPVNLNEEPPLQAPSSVPDASAAGKDTTAPTTVESAVNETEEPAAIQEDDDVIFVWETTPSEEQRRRAEELLLPPTFFLYEDHCNEEEDHFSEYEEEILNFIDRRDFPQYYRSSSTEEEKEDEEPHEAPEDDNRSASIFQELSISQDENKSEASAADSDQTDQVQTGNLFQNYTSSSGFTFSQMAASASNKHAFGERKDAAFKVSEASKVLFSGAPEDQDADPEAYNPHYKPVLAEPPPLVEVKTGEEDEEVLFKERCKLFRFDAEANAWKERGVGDLKILHHPERGWYRVVMRREQILKLCANHRIQKHMDLREIGEKAWTYSAQNKNEDNEIVMETFSVRFKNPQIAAQFKEVWETARSEMS